MRLQTTLAAATLLLAAHPAPAQTVADLPAILECKATPEAYFAFRRWLSAGGPPVAKAGLRWSPSPAYLASYTLAHSINVFGHPTSRIGLIADGIVAELGGVTPAALAHQLGLHAPLEIGPILQTNKLVSENEAAKTLRAHPQPPPTVDDLFAPKPPSGPDAQQTVQLVTNLGQPGKTMTGCNYLSTAQTPTMPLPQR